MCTVFETGGHGRLSRLGHAVVKLLGLGEKVVGVRHAAHTIALQRASVATAQFRRIVAAKVLVRRHGRRSRRRHAGRVHLYRATAIKRAN